mgnify:CR=1 FL=1
MRVKLNSVDDIERIVQLNIYGEDKTPAQYVCDESGAVGIYKKQGKERALYITEPMFLDTETSHNHKDGDEARCWVYQWACLYHGYTVGGRTPSQLIDYLDKYIKLYGLCESRKMVIYIHNASYDLSYLMYFFKEHYGDIKMLNIKAHKVLSFECVNVGLVFRCSYLLSNRSLDQWGEYTGAPVRKVVNGIDYDLIRYQDTPLTYNDWYYQVNDVWAMSYAYSGMLEMFDDDIISIPLTNTGYIRRDVRHEFKKDKDNRERFIRDKIDEAVYTMLRLEFAGGLAHGNRFYIGRTIRGLIGHDDYKSDYPSQQVMKYYPITGFSLYYKRGISQTQITLEDLIDLCNTRCVLMRVRFNNFRIKNGITLPCLSVDKCNKGRLTPLVYTLDGVKRGNDNGRVLCMDGVTELCLLEKDLYWILRQYDTDGIQIDTVYTAMRGKHPKYVLDVINEYFKIKENASGKEREKSKNNLNAGYGMEATDPVRLETEFDFDKMQWIENKAISSEDIQTALDKYYKSRNSFMQYYLGCYVTMWARDSLISLTEAIGYNRFLYCDTDSIFYLKDSHTEQVIKDYNDRVIAYNKANNLGVLNKSGTMSYYGVFEDEGEGIRAFKFLHSKCYAFIDKDDKMHLTVAGVRKSVLDKDGNTITSVDELTKFGKYTYDEALDRFTDLFVFEKCGGVSALYIYDEPHIEVIDGHKIETAGGCILRQVTKTLNEIKWLKEYYTEEEADYVN